MSLPPPTPPKRKREFCPYCGAGLDGPRSRAHAARETAERLVGLMSQSNADAHESRALIESALRDAEARARADTYRLTAIAARERGEREHDLIRATPLFNFAHALDALAAGGENTEQRQRTEAPAQASATGSPGLAKETPFDSVSRPDCSTPPSASPTPGDEARAKLMLDARHFLNERGVGLPAREWLLADFALVQLQPIRQVLAPVLSWYDGGGEIAEPPLSELVRLAVEDLVADRAQCLALRAELEQARAERNEALALVLKLQTHLSHGATP